MSHQGATAHWLKITYISSGSEKKILPLLKSVLQLERGLETSMHVLIVTYGNSSVTCHSKDNMQAVWQLIGKR